MTQLKRIPSVQSHSTQVDMLVFLGSLTREVTGMMRETADVAQTGIQSILDSLAPAMRPHHAAGLGFEIGCRRLLWLLTAPPSMYLRNAQVSQAFLWVL